jgi:hypothetical protein
MEHDNFDPKQGASRQYRDRLFRKIFKDKKKALELFNAIEHTAHTDEEQVKICTLDEDSLFAYFNDLAIGVGDTYIALFEHQSSINPNMPLRVLPFIATILYRESNEKLYNTEKVLVPTPRFYMLYNGKARLKDEKTVLRLSDSFKDRSKAPMFSSDE